MRLPRLIKLLENPIINVATSVKAPNIFVHPLDVFNQMKTLLAVTILQKRMQIKIKLSMRT